MNKKLYSKSSEDIFRNPFDPINYASRLQGLQLGLVNMAMTAEEGVQIGVINIISQTDKWFSNFERYHFLTRCGIEKLLNIRCHPS